MKIKFNHNVTAGFLQDEEIKEEDIYFFKDKEYDVKFEDNEYFILEPDKKCLLDGWYKLNKNRTDYKLIGEKIEDIFPCEFITKDKNRDGYNIFIPIEYSSNIINIFNQGTKFYKNSIDEILRNIPTIKELNKSGFINKQLLIKLIREEEYSIMKLEKSSDIANIITNNIKKLNPF